MRAATRLRSWDIAHRWSSLVCTLFVLLLCLTGLPLIFSREIDAASGLEVKHPPWPAGTSMASLDKVVQVAVARHPGRTPLFASQEADDDGIWYVTLGAPPADTDLVQVAVDARSAVVLAEPKVGQAGLMGVIRSLHVDLFAGLAGRLFLGSMGLVFLVSIVSGVVLYAPFMRRLDFGAVRHGRGARVQWLDLHNLIGISTVAWTLVVGVTGTINTCADLLTAHWRTAELQRLQSPTPAAVAPHPPGGEGAERAIAAARLREPQLTIAFVAFPGSSFSSPDHYAVFMRGATALTARLVRPVLIDARSGAVSASGGLPWYLTALFIAQPLHFGDYGGLPLKILWAIFDVAAVLVTASGVYLWFARRPPPGAGKLAS